eukprot:CAMPEP_0176237310 /NCGR_PEP_ID=MMETSP0121_2-20121125/27786_1 /TAXON_ID=160619 /ORGANISM="Kryptoperidinium foliaceum, Strain CCMP 1326" /LENGTH=47 /DNA_ID= /DNA_START= /DNA_END= /DNA_ORIENTATION=
MKAAAGVDGTVGVTGPLPQRPSPKTTFAKRIAHALGPRPALAQQLHD